jgi:hypothetical protein
VIILREGRVDLSSKYFLKRSRIKRTVLKNWLDPSHGLNIVKGRAIFSGTCPKIYDFLKIFELTFDVTSLSLIQNLSIIA